jgi:hypothetical protein
LGQGRRYAHPFGSIDPTLIEVPWLVIEKEERRIDTTEVSVGEKQPEKPDEPTETAETETEQEELKRKLKSLGYYD